MGLRAIIATLSAGLAVLLAQPAAVSAQGVDSANDPLGALVAQATVAPPAPAVPPPIMPATVAPAPAQDAVGGGGLGAEGSPSSDYILGPEDVVELEVLGRQDFRIRAKIAQDGTILLPYIGQVPASDRTTQQLAGEVTRMLEAGGYFSRPILRVEVVSFASRYVTVLGAVGSPGLVPINRPYRLSEILARVGGISSASADYVVVRPEEGPEQRYSIKALTTGELSQDPFVAPGDKIFLPTAEIYYISGQVRSPGQYAVASEMTLRMAIARAGGLTELGSDRRIKINRKGQKVGRIDLDDLVQPGDVIDVGERLF